MGNNLDKYYTKDCVIQVFTDETEDNLTEYQELQNKAKIFGIRANYNTEKLRYSVEQA